MTTNTAYVHQDDVEADLELAAEIVHNLMEVLNANFEAIPPTLQTDMIDNVSATLSNQ